MSDALLALFIVLIVVAGIVGIAAMIINAVVKVKIAKYNSIRMDAQPEKKQDGVWPPPPTTEPTPPQAAIRSNPQDTLPKREGEE